MKVLVFGATGMVGKGALLEALDDARVDAVVAVVRRSLGLKHAKLQELIHKDFADYSGVDLSGVDACLFCLGVSSAGMNEADYTVVTYDYAIAAATRLQQQSPNAVFCFISGEGTNAESKTMWARVKGKTENELLRRLGDVGFMFRPGYIHPERGVSPSGTPWLKAFYAVLGPLQPALKLVASSHMTTSSTLGRAMVRAAVTRSAPKKILECPDINAFGAL